MDAWHAEECPSDDSAGSADAASQPASQPASRKRAAPCRSDGDEPRSQARPRTEDLPDGMTLQDFEEAMLSQPTLIRERDWDSASISALIDQLHDFWSLDQNMTTADDAVAWACDRFGIAQEELSLLSNATTSDHSEHIHRRLLRKIATVTAILELVHHETFVPEEADATAMVTRLGEVACVMSNGSDMLRSACNRPCPPLPVTATLQAPAGSCAASRWTRRRRPVRPRPPSAPCPSWPSPRPRGPDPLGCADPSILGNRFLHLIQAPPSSCPRPAA